MITSLSSHISVWRLSVQSPYRNVGGAVELQPSSSHASSYKILAEERAFVKKVFCESLHIKMHLQDRL